MSDYIRHHKAHVVCTPSGVFSIFALYYDAWLFATDMPGARIYSIRR